MKSTFTLAAMAAVLSSSFASPIDSSVTVEKRDDPSICVPTGREAKYGYEYWDESATCQDAKVGTGCCMTLLSSGAGIGCKIESKQELSDLRNVVGQHISKTGQWDTTEVGKWFATYELLAHDKVNPDVLQEWYHALGPDEGNVRGDFAGLLFSYKAEDAFTRLRVTCDRDIFASV